MKIFGLGIDIIKISRIKKIINKFKKKFIKKILTKKEIIYYLKNKKTKKYIAKIFSVKESASKALGTGMRFGINFKNFEISNNKFGKPKLKFFKKSKKIFKKKKIKKIHVSISYEKKYIFSMVILER
ncbi:holo-ACP synthase [Buchnera aphidicola]|uniref:holo-ACP synthase n=1 Tax=Buchnera aphidicola TaxID=9 RepID=UPI0031B867F3